MDAAQIAFVLSAGAFTVVSPCGYPVLIAYLSYYAGSKIPIRKAFVGGSVVAIGFLTVFVVIGLLPAIVGQVVFHYVPMLILVAGVVVIAIGLITLFGVKLSIRLQSLIPTRQSGLRGQYVFGLAFGMAAAGCSAPIFLTIILFAMTSGGFVEVMSTFVVYALGMAVSVIASGVLVVSARQTFMKRLAKIRPWFDRISGMIMILVGIYMIYYYFETYYL